MTCRLVLPLAMLLALFGAGCKSSPKGPGSDSLAAITVKDRSMLEVAKATSEVFQEEGFIPVPQTSSKREILVFDRKGTTGDKILYGNWDASPIWYRARIQFTPLDANTLLVRCDAFRVLNRGEPHFEDEQRLSDLKAGTYREMLEKVKVRLGAGS